MPLQLSEREAEALFARINRPMPRSEDVVHKLGVEAVKRSFDIDAAGLKAVAKALGLKNGR